MLITSLLGLAVFIAWAYLALGHGAFWLPLFPKGAVARTEMPSVDIVVPARNEADMLPRTLTSLLSQEYAGAWKVILVDDHSQDNTRDAALKIAADMGKSDRLIVIAAPDLAEGWRGKVSAMNAGVIHSKADFVLFTDADIRHPASTLEKLTARAESEGLDLVSRMVVLNCESFAEKFLIPAFVFFFGMLFPFRRVNDPKSSIAAAAGGVMLVRRTTLDIIGGLACIKWALIDDCNLAKAFKDSGAKIELALTRDIESLRSYPHIKDIWEMVTRTAYTQLRLSPLLLIGTTLGMIILYLLPLMLFLFAPAHGGFLTGFGALVLMIALYIPIVKFYRLPWIWAMSLPLAAIVYALATLDSARLYYQGKGGLWKGRAQASR